MMYHKIFIWLKAARLPSQSYILLPILLGQMIAYSISNQFSWELFYLLLAFSIFIQFFIIFANDFADQETDSLNKTYTLFSGGSRVLVDGDLKATDLKRATIILMTLCLGIGLVFNLFYHRHFSLFFVISSFLLLWAYSYKPIQLSYRGGGELLQMLGLGFVLPLFSFYIQSDSFQGFPFSLLAVLFPTHLACAIATSLPDQPSDQISSKNSFTVKWGSGIAKTSILILQSIASICLWIYYNSKSSIYFNEFFYFVPLFGILFTVFFFKSQPGNTRLSLFVFFSLFTTMTIEAGLILIYYVLS